VETAFHLHIDHGFSQMSLQLFGQWTMGFNFQLMFILYRFQILCHSSVLQWFAVLNFEQNNAPTDGMQLKNHREKCLYTAYGLQSPMFINLNKGD